MTEHFDPNASNFLGKKAVILLFGYDPVKRLYEHRVPDPMDESRMIVAAAPDERISLAGCLKLYANALIRGITTLPDDMDGTLVNTNNVVPLRAVADDYELEYPDEE